MRGEVTVTAADGSGTEISLTVNVYSYTEQKDAYYQDVLMCIEADLRQALEAAMDAAERAGDPERSYYEGVASGLRQALDLYGDNVCDDPEGVPDPYAQMGPMSRNA